MIAFRNSASNPLTSGATSTTIPIPSGVQAGDFLVAWVELGNIVSAFNNPAGWTQFSWSPLIDGVNSNAWAFWKIAVAGEPAPTISWTTTSKGVIVCDAYSGVDTVNPLGNNNAQIETVTQTTATTPTLTAVANQWAKTIHSSRTSTTANKSPTWTAPSGEIQENATDNGAAAAAPWSAVVTYDSNGLVTIGSHSYTATSNFSEGHHKSALIYLNVAVPTAAPVVPNWQQTAQPSLVRPAIVLRSSLADVAAASVATPAPTVVTVAASAGQVGRPVVVRGSLQDFATPVTPQPVVVTTAALPVVVPARGQWIRASLQDFATPVTPQPVVPNLVRIVVDIPAPARLSRTSLTDPAGNQPVVVSRVGLPSLPAGPLIVRGSLADAVVTAGAPDPLVVSVRAAMVAVGRPVVSGNAGLGEPLTAGHMTSADIGPGLASMASAAGMVSTVSAGGMVSTG